MILFVIGLIALIIIAIFTIFTLGAGGIVFILLFGDVIVCALLVYWIIRFICRKKKKDK